MVFVKSNIPAGAAELPAGGTLKSAPASPPALNEKIFAGVVVVVETEKGSCVVPRLAEGCCMSVAVSVAVDVEVVGKLNGLLEEEAVGIPNNEFVDETSNMVFVLDEVPGNGDDVAAEVVLFVVLIPKERD